MCLYDRYGYVKYVARLQDAAGNYADSYLGVPVDTCDFWAPFYSPLGERYELYFLSLFVRGNTSHCR